MHCISSIFKPGSWTRTDGPLDLVTFFVAIVANHLSLVVRCSGDKGLSGLEKIGTDDAYERAFEDHPPVPLWFSAFCGASRVTLTVYFAKTFLRQSRLLSHLSPQGDVEG